MYKWCSIAPKLLWDKFSVWGEEIPNADIAVQILKKVYNGISYQCRYQLSKRVSCGNLDYL